MACSACSKRKIVRQNQRLVTVSSRTFNDFDFRRVVYTGESGQVVGVYTEINYGVRTTGDQMLVHNDDFNHESNTDHVIFGEVE